LDPELARRMEPRAAAPHRRLQALKTLAGADIPAGVLASPMIPGLNDAHLDKILQAAAAAGAGWAGYTLIRLPYQVADLFQDWLQIHYPLLKDKVLGRIRQTRSGRLSDAKFHGRMKGSGPHADLLEQRFRLGCRRYGLSTRFPVPDCSGFRVPVRAQQAALFRHDRKSSGIG
ncbi:MAG: radical SAM protein, partial [Acidobacteriota bacterium]